MADCALIAEGATPERISASPGIAEVYDAHVDFVARMARGLGVPPSGVGDVVQDVFLAVHRKLDDFEGRSKLRTWIASVVINVVRSHRRAHQRRRLHDAFDEERMIDAREKAPDEAVLEREAVELLMRILEPLPEEQRAVFLLSEIEGLEMAEIAEALGINVNTGYSRLRLARKAYARGLARARSQAGREER